MLPQPCSRIHSPPQGCKHIQALQVQGWPFWTKQTERARALAKGFPLPSPNPARENGCNKTRCWRSRRTHAEPSISFLPQILTECLICAWPCSMWWGGHKLPLCPHTLLRSVLQVSIRSYANLTKRLGHWLIKRTEADSTQEHLVSPATVPLPPMATNDSGWSSLMPRKFMRLWMLPTALYNSLQNSVSYLMESQKEKNNISKCFPSIYSF